MKKILLSIIGFVLCTACMFTAVGCKPKDYGETTTSTTGVTANGGSSVVYDGHLYFTNGFASNDGKTNGGTIGSIYKVAIANDGSIAEDATYTKVVDALVGYDKGSINIIGDFLYYTTPGTGENNKGEVLYNKTAFMRYNLVNGKTQEIYKTADNNADESVTFAYYKTGAENKTLNLVVYESVSKTLKSFKIGNEIETVFEKTDVKSAVFSDKMGVSEQDSADRYVFYTLAAKENAIDTTVNRVYRIGADGSNEALINDNANLSLLCIRAGKLLFTTTFGTSTNTYAYKVVADTKNGDITIAKDGDSTIPHINSDRYVVCRNKYDDIVFLEEGDKVGTLYMDGDTLTYARFNGGSAAELTYSICTISGDVQFVGTFEDSYDSKGYLTYIVTEGGENHLYKVRYTFTSQTDVQDENPEHEQLSTSNIKIDTEDVKYGNMLPEIIDEYAYVFVTDEDNKVFLHRINLHTPEEIEEHNPSSEPVDEEDLEIGAAEIVGGSRI